MKTVSIETARLLKEAGWKPKTGEQTMFYVRLKVNRAFPFEIRPGYINHVNVDEERLAAPDTDELLAALPKWYAIGRTSDGEREWGTWEMLRDTKVASFPGDGVLGARKEMTQTFISFGATPAEALAALWLELHKQKLV